MRGLLLVTALDSDCGGDYGGFCPESHRGSGNCRGGLDAGGVGDGRIGGRVNELRRRRNAQRSERRRRRMPVATRVVDASPRTWDQRSEAIRFGESQNAPILAIGVKPA